MSEEEVGRTKRRLAPPLADDGDRRRFAEECADGLVEKMEISTVRKLNLK
jgi:hypothetical protein